MTLASWNNFFLGELGAAAALAGLLFVSVSVNQARILEIGRMADRALEALTMLLLVIITSSVALIPDQPLRLLGAEILLASLGTLVRLIQLQRKYLAFVEPQYRPPAIKMIWMNRLAIALVGVSGLALAASNDVHSLLIAPAGVLLTFVAVGLNAWILLIEINR